MPTNVEIKARVDRLETLLPVIAALADAGPEHVVQDDTFFSCEGGRLKLRALRDDHGVLIYYRRADELGPKTSFYVHSETSDPDGLRSVLALAYGESGRVRKRRMVFRIGQARIHLDRVDGLGDFLELEVGVEDGLEPDAATSEAHRLVAAFGIEAGAMVSGAYVDLLSALASDSTRGHDARTT
ncbi:class IV adenylate cyclase [Arthrobacter sp. ISL-5]|uniref:class IV adenylate cyclase n=1 Tax=Arthrobacter sp. ISL-5 TaxID=2819111 RepID=UPI001BE86DDB|nr:class IV adenylate cyclase [Arthrobacter sp. ISL-5]MBT2555554.1 class IV adenylate cyclase [Arthrobacter sp. ISL-5]